MRTDDVPDTCDNENWQRLGDVAARVTKDLLERIEKSIGEIEKALEEDGGGNDKD